MNNKYSVACITLVRDKYKKNPMEWIKYSLVYTADSIRTFDSKSNRTADSIRDSIQKTIRRSLYLLYPGAGFFYTQTPADSASRFFFG